MLPVSFSLQGATFNKVRTGIYISSNVALGGPANELRFRANSGQKKGSVSFSVTRLSQAYNGPETLANRKLEQGTFTLSYNGPMSQALTLADLEYMVKDFPLILSSVLIKELIQGAN